jgi:hypothetical protein
MDIFILEATDQPSGLRDELATISKVVEVPEIASKIAQLDFRIRTAVELDLTLWKVFCRLAVRGFGTGGVIVNYALHGECPGLFSPIETTSTLQ